VVANVDAKHILMIPGVAAARDTQYTRFDTGNEGSDIRVVPRSGSRGLDSSYTFYGQNTKVPAHGQWHVIHDGMSSASQRLQPAKMHLPWCLLL
jgi:hypothetical protein